MIGDDDEFVFPIFAGKALNQTKSKTDSKVSALWSIYFKNLYESFQYISERVNAELTSHCHKKGSNQLMAETSTVSGIAGR